jgi:hypothetical protein
MDPNSFCSSVVGKVIYKYMRRITCEEIHYGQEGNVTETFTKYEFDKKNNWIRRKKIQDGKVVEIKERDVKYY